LSQNLRDIMTTNVVSVTSNQSVREAAALMSQHNIGSLPVVDNGMLTGIVTDRDITIRCTSQGMNPDSPVSQFMSTNLVSGNSTMDVHEAANLMAQQQIRRLPVVDNQQLVGMVALGDLATTQIYQNEASQALSSISIPADPQL
jgi:CBS domain-containing protein